MLFSIVIPLYNKEGQIANTLRSVFAQTCTDYEIVIVNDGSTDGSAAAVEAINDPRIRLIHQQNAGVSAARNRGIAEARGQYIALLDADDEWKPEYLATISELICKYPDCDVFATRYEFEDEYGNKRKVILRHMGINGKDGIVSNYFKVASHSDAPLWTSAVVASKKALIHVNGFPEGVTSGEDLLTWAKLACEFKIAISNRIEAVYYTPTTGPTGIVPKDLKTTKDFVGTELVKLWKRFPYSGIKEYIAFWYKMRAAINLRRLNRMSALKCAYKSIRYSPTLWKAWIIASLSFAPKSIINKL